MRRNFQRNVRSRTAVLPAADGGKPYRHGVLLVVCNRRGGIFIGKSTKRPADGKPWQLPQGGIKDFGTHRERVGVAARRELAEELGPMARFRLLRILPEPVAYLFPDASPKYRGQKLSAVLLLCLSPDGRFDIGRIEEGDGQPAFSAWKWASPDEVMRLATAAKVDVYAQVMKAFAPAIAARTLTQRQRTVRQPRTMRPRLAMPEP